MLNKIILIGRMTKDPEQRGKDSEKPIAYFRVAVDRDFKREGEPEADFFDCSVFGQQAKFVLQYGRKGRLLCVVGAMQHREWQDQQTGEKRTSFEVVRVDVHFLDKKPDDVQTDNKAQPTAAPAAPGYIAPVPQPAMPQAAPAAPASAMQALPTAGYPQPIAAASAAPATVMQAQSAAGYPKPVPGAAAQFTVPDFSGVPESYAWGPGGVPTSNTPF